jgi:hypothetical protein
MEPKTIHLNTKCSDQCDVTVLDTEGNPLKRHYGYVPHFFPKGGGDYLRLEIDATTGQILNWGPDVMEAIREFVDPEF